MSQPDSVDMPSARRWPNRRAAIVLGAGTLAPKAVLALRPAWLPLADGDRVLVADVENLTGDPTLDHSLGAALEVALSQSTYVNVFPRDRIRTALRRLAKPQDGAVDTALAIQLAVHEGLSMVVALRIARRGSAYALSASLIDPQTRDAIAGPSVQATRREGVLDSLEALSVGVRRRLGEPQSRIAERDTPLSLATSPSLEALARFADSVRFKVGEEHKGEELLRQAIELDADFALAIAALAVRHYQFSDRERRLEGNRLFARALALPHRLTLRARQWLVIAADDARGNREEAAAGYRAFIAQYPNDTTAWFRLGWTYMATLKRRELAVEAFQRVTQIDPGHAAAWINLATCYQGGRQYEKAIATYHRAFALSPEFRLALFVNGEYGSTLVHLGRMDEARAAFVAMREAPDDLRRARGRRSMAFLLMHTGRYRAAIEELDEAIRINTDPQQRLSVFRDRFIRASAYLALGAAKEARQELDEVNRWIAQLSLGPVWLVRVVKLRARLGDVGEARRLTSLMAAAVGNAQADTGIGYNVSDDNGYLDLARSELERRAGRADAALAHATAAALRLSDTMVLASAAGALHSAGRLEEAAAKYRQLIQIAPFGYEEQEDAAAAQVALAGLYEQLGRSADARALYEKLSTQWKDGDADLVLLKQSRSRLKALVK